MSADLLETVAQLCERRPLDQTAVEDLFDVALRQDESNTNPYITKLLAFRRPPEIKSVEVRVPAAQATRKGPIVILDLDPELVQLGQAQVKARFGDKPTLDVPTPRQPPESPIYLNYKQSWGTLRFGFARPKTELLTTIVVDADK